MQRAPFVVQSDAERHLRIDADAMDAAFDQPLPPSGSVLNIGSPWHMVVWNRLRTEYGIRTESAIPADVILWGQGPAPDPRVTRIGGIPFMPTDEPWPEFEGKPATFLIQFNFEDSRDLYPDLPGDILLVFVSGSNFIWEEDSVRTIWVSSTADNVITSAPDPAWEFPEAFGVRLRSYDDEDAYELAYERDEDADQSLWFLPVLVATKIGGSLWDAQENAPELPNGWRFLCQFASFSVASDVPWPWANREEPADPSLRERRNPQRKLVVGDMGVVGFCLDEEQQVQVWG